MTAPRTLFDKIWDSHGREYIDGLAGLFVTQVGHGRGLEGLQGGLADQKFNPRPPSPRCPFF